MFIGHDAVALAAKQAAPKTSLGTIAAASVGLDLLGSVLVLLGVEHLRIAPGATQVTPIDFSDYPFSHSLGSVLGWSVLFGGVHFVWNRDGRSALVLGAAVLSHWVCDWLVHRPDLPLLPHGPHVGLGIWNSLAGTLALEGGMFIAGLWVYVRTSMSS